jgi:SsrA-binding protein
MNNSSHPALVVNKRATYDYEILQTYTAGLVLSGAEVKSLRLKQASLGGAFVQILADGRAVLLNSQITPYKYADNRNYDPRRTRHLLLRRSEIFRLQEAISQKGYTLVPLSIFAAGHFIKLTIGVCRGKKQFEKREHLKKRDLEREARFNY